MSYIALYRKYRPQKFSDVINQEHIKKTLINALALEKVAHAYLFSGPRGVGKTTIGRLLSKAVNCTKLDKKLGEPCGNCENCQEISSDKSVDIIEIDAASNRGIDEIRELREKIKYMPSKLRFRVFIIDEVHMLTIEAFNALLKTLEEPPRHVIFILATTEPQKVPATILSRCQRFDFKKIRVDELVEHLKIISKKEKINISEEALKIIAMNSDGSSRDALSLLGQVQSAFDQSDIKEDDIVDLLGLANGSQIIDLAFNILEKDVKISLENVNDLIMKGYDPILLLDSLIEFLRNLLLFKNTNNQDSFITHKEQKTKIKELIKNIDNKNIIILINLLIESKNIQKYSTISQLPLEMAIIGYIQPDDVNAKLEDNDSNNKKSTENLKEIKSDNNAPEEVSLRNSDKSKNKEYPKVDYAAIDSKWAEIVENITSTNYSLGLTLRSSKPIKVSGNALILECAYSFHKDCIQNSKNREIIEKIIFDKIGSQLIIKCVVCEKQPNIEGQPENEKKEQVDSSSDLVNTALDIMGGEVVKK